MMNKGFMLKNAHFNYVPTYTGPGHSSVYTGTTPRVHGIIANEWYEKRSGGWMYCAGDSTVSAVGGSKEAGKISARNMLSTTITDELGQFYQNQSKIVGISIKDRGAALPAGHNSTGAFWYDDVTGTFMSSTYYLEALPGWVIDFNKLNLVNEYMSGVWDTTYPIDTYTESAEDDREGEVLVGGKTSPVFPYDLSEMSKNEKPTKLIKRTPFGNKLLKELAIAAVDGEKMGTDEITDFLAVSFSSTDYVGHDYGPYSKEIEDTYIKLDQELQDLLEYLDKKVGAYKYTVFLTADHAVAEIPAYLKSMDFPVDYFQDEMVKTEILETLNSKFGRTDLISSVSNHQVFLNKQAIRDSDIDETELKALIIDILSDTYGIAGAYDAGLLNGYSGSNKDIQMLAAGYNAHRSGDILFTFNSGWLGEYNKKEGGTTHGSHYTYDTHVPMIFYGMNIPMGSSMQYHPITDLAPTLSMLLNIKIPSGATGHPIEELFYP